MKEVQDAISAIQNIRKTLTKSNSLAEVLETKERIEILLKAGTHQELVTVHGKTKTFQALRKVGTAEKESGGKINAQEFGNKLADVIKKHFPNSRVEFGIRKFLGKQSLSGIFTLGKQGEYENGIVQNDPMMHSFDIEAPIDDKGEIDSSKITIDTRNGGIITSTSAEHKAQPYLAYGRIKLGWRKKTGTAKQIIDHLDKYFAAAKKTAIENKQHIPHSAKNLD